jgi:hypothetical protein
MLYCRSADPKEKTVFKISAAIVVAVVAATTFSSNADARAGGSFYASPFFRNQGRQPAQSVDPSYERRKRDAATATARARARKLEAARDAARQEAAAKRARLQAQQKKQAAKDVAEKNVDPSPQTTTTTNVTSAAKKEDRLPVSAENTSSNTAAVTSTAATAKTGSTPDASPEPASRVCRKYSAAADGLVEIPCN